MSHSQTWCWFWSGRIFNMGGAHFGVPLFPLREGKCEWDPTPHKQYSLGWLLSRYVQGGLCIAFIREKEGQQIRCLSCQRLVKENSDFRLLFHARGDPENLCSGIGKRCRRKKKNQRFSLPWLYTNKPLDMIGCLLWFSLCWWGSSEVAVGALSFRSQGPVK